MLTKAPLALLALAVLMLFAAPQAALAQPFFHGLAVAKQCETPKLVGQTTSCLIIAANTIDGAGDTITVTGMFDIVKASPSDVRVPVAGDLPITATAGGTSCAPGPAFPCSLPPGGSVTVHSNSYVIDADDPSPLPDQGQIAWADQCNGTADGACNTAPNAASAPAQTNIVQCLTVDDCGSDPGVCADNTCVANVCGISYTSATTQCRASAGACDVAESCTGSTADCPADGFASATTECRASAGVCDVAESCTGSSAACPGDGFVSATTECRASAGVCDVAESCTGSSAACPADGFASATTQCRAGVPEVCDPAESCTGNSADCPADDQGAGCVPAACRTVGYWGTHGGTEKNSVNITQGTINEGGGSLLICGETLTNTYVDNGSSVLEGICDSGGGKIQLTRQLIAMALNCISSGSPGPANCVGITPFEAVFTACNAYCATGTDEQINACVPVVDCLNNGGTPATGPDGFFCASGTCSDNQEPCTAENRSLCATPDTATCAPAESTCHDQPLLFPDSPASSSKACNDARKNDCTIFNTSCATP